VPRIFLQAYVGAAADAASRAVAANFVLEEAAVSRKSQSLRFALSIGADVNIKDDDGEP